MFDPLLPSAASDENPLPEWLRLRTAAAYAGVGRSVMLQLVNRRLVKAIMKRLPDAQGTMRRILLINRSSIDRLMESLADGRQATWRV